MPDDLGEDAPELTPRHGCVIGAVFLLSGSAAIIGAGALATAAVAPPESPAVFLLCIGALGLGFTGQAVYFLAGDGEGVVRGHQPFEAILWWISAAGLAGIALALGAVGVRAIW